MERKVHNVVMQEYVRLQKSEKSLLFFINNISRLTATERELIKKLLEGKTVKDLPFPHGLTEKKMHNIQIVYKFYNLLCPAAAKFPQKPLFKGIFLIWNGGKNSEDGGLPQNGKWQGAFDCGVESGVDGCVCMS